MTTVDDVIHDIDALQLEREARLRQILIDAGRIDILADYDRQMRDLRLGLSTARNVWHSISARQREALQALGTGATIERRQSRYYRASVHGELLPGTYLLATMRALCAHNLAHVDGGATDPEARFVITERGSFVLKHGAMQ